MESALLAKVFARNIRIVELKYHLQYFGGGLAAASLRDPWMSGVLSESWDVAPTHQARALLVCSCYRECQVAARSYCCWEDYVP